MPRVANMLRGVAILSALTFCNADYPYTVKVAEPRSESSQNYTSLDNGKTLVDDVMYGWDHWGRLLKVFPCQDLKPPPNVKRLMVPMDGLPFKATLKGPKPGEEGGPSDITLGAWGADVFWGEYEGTKFDFAGLFTPGQGLAEAFRTIGDGNWCQNWLPTPYYHRKIGGDENSGRHFDSAELDGANATLAVRFTYYDLPGKDALDASIYDLKMVHVETECIYVQFSASTPSYDACRYHDNGELTAQEALDAAMPSLSSTAISPWSSSTASAAPYDDDDDFLTGTDPGRTITVDVNPGPDTRFIGIGLGLAAGTIVILYLLLRWASARKRAAHAAAGGTTIALAPARRRPEDPEVVQFPAPAYQPREADAGGALPGAAAGEDDRSKAVGELPNYGDLPPRYEDVNAGSSRQT